LFIITISIGIVIGSVVTYFLKEQVLKQESLASTPKQIESKVLSWLVESDYESKYNIRKDQAENIHFCFVVTNKEGDNIDIKLFKSQGELLKFQNNLELSSDDQKAINKLSSIELHELLFNIKNSLNNAELGFDVIEPLKIITLKKSLFIESLTRSSFFDVLNRLKRGRAMTSTSLYTALRKN